MTSSSTSVELATRAVARAKSELPTCNVLVAGAAGTGKSTLINAVFGSELAATGIGPAVTASEQQYVAPDVPLTIRDTRGLEQGEAARVEAFLQRVDALALEGPAVELHVAWYCIAVTSRRLQPSDRDLIRSLATRVPVIVVLTQADEPEDEAARQLREAVLAPGEPDVQVAVVLAKPREIAGARLEAFGVDRLVEMTKGALEEHGRRMAFVNVQRASLPAKAEVARAHVRERVLEPGGVGDRLARAWSHDIDRWSLRPVQSDLLSLLTEVALSFGGSAERGDVLSAVVRHDLADPTRAIRDWTSRPVQAPLHGPSAEAQRALLVCADAFIDIAADAVRADLDGRPVEPSALIDSLRAAHRHSRSGPSPGQQSGS
jgi:GTPase Era involved in 16S rRNA processing